MDAKCRWRSDWLDGTVSFREPFGQTKVMQIRQGELLNHQGAITYEVCCLVAQCSIIKHFGLLWGRLRWLQAASVRVANHHHRSESCFLSSLYISKAKDH